MSYSIIVFDNHRLFCEGLCSLIYDNNRYCIKEIFDTKNDCLSYLRENSCDILLMDNLFPNYNSIDIINSIKKLNTSIKIVFLTNDVKSSDLLKAYDIGIDGYISKTSSFETFLFALDKIVNDEKYFEPDVLPIINRELLVRDNHDELLCKLTKREKQILIRVATGMSNKEIAVDCHISERTVKNHLSSIFQKIEVADRTQAAVFAIRTNLVSI